MYWGFPADNENQVSFGPRDVSSCYGKKTEGGYQTMFSPCVPREFCRTPKICSGKKPEPHPESPCWPPFLGPLASRAHRRPTQFSHTHVISSPISTTSVRNQREHEHTKSHRTHWSSSSSANSQSFLDDSRAQLLIPIPFRGWLPILFPKLWIHVADLPYQLTLCGHGAANRGDLVRLLDNQLKAQWTPRMHANCFALQCVIHFLLERYGCDVHRRYEAKPAAHLFCERITPICCCS